MMLAGGVAEVVITDPPDGGGDPDPGGDGYPETDDMTLLALRPVGVRNLATATATPGDAIGDLVDDITAEQVAEIETVYGADGPDHSAVLFLPPGEYAGGFGTGRWLAIVGTSGDPADVIIYSDTIQADGVMHPYSPVYIEGVTLKGSWNAELDQSPKYAAHIVGSQRTTFANVIFDVTEAHIDSAANGTWGCAGTVGMDGSPGTTVIFYKCTFLDVTGQARLGMNLHAGPTGTIASTVSFIDCTAAKGVGYNGPAGGAEDEVYVVGGTIGGTIAVGDGVHVYTDHDNTVTGATGTTRDFTDWPIPTEHGLSDLWLDYYYPSSLTVAGTTNLVATVTDTAPMTPVSGRTYYCPIPIAAAVHVNRWGIRVRTGGGTGWGWRAQPDPGVYYGSPIPGNYPEASPLGTGDTLPAANMLDPYSYSWIVYPAESVGGNRVWMHFKIANTTGVTIDGSGQLPGLHDCYYSDDNGTTLIKATAGTPFPLAHAAQVL